MTDANAAQNEPATSPKPITELKVSGHLMTLDAGLYCILQRPSSAADAITGLPGVRISAPPGIGSRPDAVSISTFRGDGWLSGGGDAALVRVLGGPAHLMVTIYQAPNAREGAPQLQVTRLLDGAAPGQRPAGPAQPAAAPQAAAAPAAQGAASVPAAAPAVDMVAHIQTRGDVGGMLGEWLGVRGSKHWIEGFGLAPAQGVAVSDVEYQAVLGRGWLSPWVEGGQFCGSRGMSLPILGLRVRLRGEAAQTHSVVYSASFVDGSAVGPVADGEACEAESMAALEAIFIELRPRHGVADAPAAPTAMPEPDAAAPAAADDAGDDKPGKKRKPASRKK